MQSDDPPFLPVGTEVSAKFKGAFCEAKIKKANRSVKYKVAIKEPPYGYAMVEEAQIKGPGPFQQNQDVEVLQGGKHQKATVQFVKDASVYHVVFDDGDERTLKRSQVCLKGAKHYNEAHNLDALPLYNPEQFGSPVVAKVVGKDKKRVSRSSVNGSAQKVRPEPEESSDEEPSGRGWRRSARARSLMPKRPEREPEKDDESEEEEEAPKPKVKKRTKRAAAQAAHDNFVDPDTESSGEDETNSDEESEETGDDAGDEPRSSKKDSDKDDKKKDERKKDKVEKKLKPGNIVCAYEATNKSGKFYPAIVVSSKIYRVIKGVKPLKQDHVPMRSFMNGRYMSSSPDLVHRLSPMKFPKNIESTALKQAFSKAKEYMESNSLPNGWNLKDDIMGDDIKKMKKEKDEPVESSSEQSSDDDISDEEDEEYANNRDVFVAHFYKFQEENATPINKQPVLGGKIIDLYRFYHVVQRMGGHRKVSHAHKWRKVMARMKLEGCAGATPATVKNAYTRYLVAFSSAYTRLGYSLSELNAHTSAGKRNTRMIRPNENEKNKDKKLKRKLSVDKDLDRDRKKEKRDDVKDDSRESTEKPVDKPEKEKGKDEKEKEKRDIKKEKEDDEKKEIKEKDRERKDDKEKEREIKKRKHEDGASKDKDKRDEERRLEKERRREERDREKNREENDKEKKPKREHVSPSPARSTASSSTKDKETKDREREEKEQRKKEKKERLLREEEKERHKKHKEREEHNDKEKSSSSIDKPKEKEDKEKHGSDRKEKDPREFKRERSAAKDLIKKERKRTDSLSTTSDDETRKRKEKRKSFSVPGGKERSVEKFDGPDTSGKQQLNDLDEGYVQPHVLHHFKQGQNVRALHLGRWYNARVIQTYNCTVEQLASLLQQKVVEPPEITGDRLDAVRNHMAATKCFVHYLGWNARYDENILLHKVRVTIKDEEDSRTKLVKQIGDRITPARVEWLLSWSKSPDGIESLRSKEIDEKPTLLTAIGPYRPRRISMTQLEQISERAERAEEEKKHIMMNGNGNCSPLKHDRASSVVHGHSRSPSKNLESGSSPSTSRPKSPSKEPSPLKDRRDDVASRTTNSLQPRRVRTPNKEFPLHKLKQEVHLTAILKRAFPKHRFDKDGFMIASSTVNVRDIPLEQASANFKQAKSKDDEEREKRRKEEKRREEERERKKKEEEERIKKEKEREAERLKLKEKEEKERREREEKLRKEREKEERLKKEEEKKRREEEERKRKKDEDEKRKKREEEEKRRKKEEDERERKRKEEEEKKKKKEEEERKMKEEEERRRKEKLEKKRLEDEEREKQKKLKLEVERKEKERLKKEEDEKARKLVEQIKKDAEKAELANKLQQEQKSFEKAASEGPVLKRARREKEDEETDRLLEEARTMCAVPDDSDVAASGSETPLHDMDVDDIDKWSVSDSQSIAGGPMTSPSRGFRGKRKRMLPRNLIKKKKEDDNEEESEEEEVENPHKETFNSIRKHMWRVMETDGSIDNYEYLGLDKIAWDYEHQPESADEADNIKAVVLDRMETLRQIYYEERATVQATMKRLTRKREKEREARETSQVSQVKSPEKTNSIVSATAS